jgi:SAM-dependent methyltransferase
MDALKVFQLLQWRELSLGRGYCPSCQTEKVFIKLNATDIAVRCLSCRASLVTLALIDVIQHVFPDIRAKSVYELSARGPLVNYLIRNSENVTCSEYFDDINPGELKNGIICQDVQKLTFEDNSFDLCTSSEVFEHVPRDEKAFMEIFRVLKNNGALAFTVPLDLHCDTLERAHIAENGRIQHLCDPEYHIDPLRGNAPILAFRTYGVDIVHRLLEAGFYRAEIRSNSRFDPWSKTRPIVVAYKSRPPASIKSPDPLLLHHAERK